MKLCKDCRFHDSGNCKHEKNHYTHSVTGDENYQLNAFLQRSLNMGLGEQCGLSAAWFEPIAPEILNCPEGHRAFLALLTDGASRARCNQPDCWIGPSRPTKEAAIRAWNHMVKSFRNTPDE